MTAGPIRPASADQRGALATRDHGVVAAQRVVRLHQRLGRSGDEDRFVERHSEMRIHGRSTNRLWYLVESQRGDIGWVRADDVVRVEETLIEGDDAFVTEGGFARSRAERLASRTAILDSGDIVTVSILTDRWALLETRRGVRGWYPVSRLQKRTSASVSDPATDERVGIQVELKEKRQLLRKPNDDQSTWELAAGSPGRIAGIRTALGHDWFLLVDDVGRWGWVPAATVTPSAKTAIVTLANQTKPEPAKASPYSGSVGTGTSVAFPIGRPGDPSYSLYVAVSGSKTMGDVNVGLAGTATLSRSINRTEATEMAAASRVQVESFGGDFSGSLTYNLSSAWSTGLIAGYALSVDSTLLDTPTLAASQNGAYGSLSLAGRLTSWLSVRGSAGMSYSKAMEGAATTSRSQRITLSLRPFDWLALAGNARFAQTAGSAAKSVGGLITVTIYRGLSGGASYSQSFEGSSSFKNGAVFLDFTL